MKEMNRREFLTLTGAAVVALSLVVLAGGRRRRARRPRRPRYAQGR